MLGGLAGRSRARATGDRGSLASRGVSLVLAVGPAGPSPPRRCGRVRQMSCANPLWGAPRIHGELLTLGLDVSERTVSRYRPRTRRPPSQAGAPSSPITCTTSFHSISSRSRPPRSRSCSSSWSCRTRDGGSSIGTSPRIPLGGLDGTTDRGGLPLRDTTPPDFLHDRDGLLRERDRQPPRRPPRHDHSTNGAALPWQHPYVERLIGSIRRECLDHIVVLNERHLRRVLAAYVASYHRARTHLALQKDTPVPRPVQTARHRSRRGPVPSRRPPSSLRTSCGLTAATMGRRRSPGSKESTRLFSTGPRLLAPRSRRRQAQRRERPAYRGIVQVDVNDLLVDLDIGEAQVRWCGTTAKWGIWAGRLINLAHYHRRLGSQAVETTV